MFINLMQHLYCPKKSMFYCAWCNSHHTYSIMKNTQDFIRKDIDDCFYNQHKFPNGLLPYPSYLEHDEIRYQHPFSIIIKCEDCHKYSSVKSVVGIMCKHKDVIIRKIYNKFDPEDIFNMEHLYDYKCSTCKHSKPITYCEHSWVRVSGERFSECTVSNLVCTKCGKKKTSYSNQDTYLNPWNRDEFDI